MPHDDSGVLGSERIGLAPMGLSSVLEAVLFLFLVSLTSLGDQIRLGAKMQNLCLNCESHPARPHKVLCWSCEREERLQDRDGIDIQLNREFKIESREVAQQARLR